MVGEMKEEKGFTDWQKIGFFFVILSSIGMITGLFVRDIYIEVFFGVIFIVSALGTRINMEFRWLKEK